FIGSPAPTRLVSRGFGAQACTEVWHHDRVVERAAGNPLDFIAAYQQRFRVAPQPNMPRFCGGLAGYFGYDTVRHIEPKLATTCPPDPLDCPDILLLQTDELAVIDNLTGKLHLMVYADPGERNAYARARDRLNELVARLDVPVGAPRLGGHRSHPVQHERTQADFEAAVRRAQGLIQAGDFMQVVIGQRIAKRYDASPLALYRALRSLNPSPYMYYYHLGDVGRIAQIGSVKVSEAFAVERYSHVMHIVSHVEGLLKQGLSNMDVLRACFPAGTLSGAPKVHAMEWIDRLEPTKRGVYAGACGYLSYAGDMDVAIAIRTGVIKNGTLYVQPAAGVVADSVPAAEWQETQHKARALLRAAELAEQGMEVA
ncbi:MAG: anthranilate synthase component I family protein, partial [Burkholderiaceae bacterium]